MKLTSDFEVSVWGKNATAVRTVNLVVRPTGESVLTISRKVVDGRGRTVRGSTSIEQARLRIGGPAKTAGARSELTVTVEHAERKYPDDPPSTAPIEGLRVGVFTFADRTGTIEIRVGTPEGRGSFWETLRRGQRHPSTQTSGGA
jgi:hypothetical protein